MATRGESLAVGNPQAPEAVQAGAPVDIDAIDDPEALIKLAYAAHDAREFTAATHLWERAREIVPTRIEGYVHGASALAALGEHKQAVHVLQEAEPVFPDRKHLIVKARAYAAETRMDWHAAFDIWEEARLEWPDDIECTDGSRRVARYLPSAEKADPPAGGSTKGDDFRV
jgi:tetratricopeptide (TPR) repeat protein